MENGNLEEAKNKGIKLGLLISSLPLKDEEKKAMLNVLSQMSEEQLDRLTKILEDTYLNAKTSDEDKKLEEDLLKIKKEHEDKKEKLDSNFKSKLDDFKNSLKGKI